MIKKLTFALVLLSVLFLGGCSLYTTTTTEEVTVPDDLEIYTVEDLQGIQMNQNGILMNDLDLTGIEWTPIGTYDDPYTANFDGGGYTISNLSITEDNNQYIGLFGMATGTIDDLTISNAVIDYSTTMVTYAGILAGAVKGDVSNVNVSGTIIVNNTGSSTYAGLVAGISEAIVTSLMAPEDFIANTLFNNVATGSISVSTEYFAYVGGLLGNNYNSNLLFNQVSVALDVETSVYRTYVGGLVGHVYNGILVGYEDYVTETEIYAIGNSAVSTMNIVSNGTQASIGGLFGYSQYVEMTNNFSVATVSITGNSLFIGSSLGEDWYSTVIGNVSEMRLTVTTDNEESNYISTFVAFTTPEGSYTDCYYNVSGNVLFDTEYGVEASVENLRNASFYTDTVGWAESQLPLSDYTTLIID